MCSDIHQLTPDYDNTQHIKVLYAYHVNTRLVY